MENEPFAAPDIGRRSVLKSMVLAMGACFFPIGCSSEKPATRLNPHVMDPETTIFRSVNGDPAQNMDRILMMMGGIDRFIGPNDIVLIKPNLQWWNQGAPNMAALHFLVEKIFNRSGGFNGEVVVAENNHRGQRPWETGGWVRKFSRNSDLHGISNYNDLTGMLKARFGDKFSVCHWIDVKRGGDRVYSPPDGPGYVFCDGTGGVPLLKIDNGLTGAQKRETIMTYPIMKTARGTIIDFKNGIWENRSYSKRPLRFINLAALNHHSLYCGATSSVKNYLGIVDLSGGPNTFKDGKIVDDYYNFHTFPFDHWEEGPAPGVMGSAIGSFMKTVRRADLNITTARWSGLASRVEAPVSETNIILAGDDPVALDYHAAKYVLHPNSRAPLHDPDRTDLPLYQYLQKCAEQAGCTVNESSVAVQSYDFRKKRMQNIEDLWVNGDRVWGWHFKTIIEHLLLYFMTSK